MADGRVLALVESFLRAGVLEEPKGWQPTERGTPQGGVISPLLANLYLNPLDHQMAAAGWEMVRYADDFVILCRSRSRSASRLGASAALGKASGPDAASEKTRIVNVTSPAGSTSLGITSSGARNGRGRRA